MFASFGSKQKKEAEGGMSTRVADKLGTGMPKKTNA